MSRHASPKVGARDPHSGRRSHSHVPPTVWLDVPQGDKLSQLNVKPIQALLGDPRTMYNRGLKERYLALERKLVEMAEENARLHQVMQEISQREREKFETLMKFSTMWQVSPASGIAHPPSDPVTQASTSSATFGSQEKNPHSPQTEGSTRSFDLTPDEAYQAILSIYTASESLLPTLMTRQQLAQSLAQDSARRQAELEKEMSQQRLKQQQQAARLARRRARKMNALLSSSVSSSSALPESSSAAPSFSSAAVQSSTPSTSASPHLHSPGKTPKAPLPPSLLMNPFEALGLTMEQAKFRLRLRTGSFVQVWIDGEWVEGTVTRFRSGSSRYPGALHAFETLMDDAHDFSLPDPAWIGSSRTAATSDVHSTTGTHMLSDSPVAQNLFPEPASGAGVAPQIASIIPLQFPVPTPSNISTNSTLSTPQSIGSSSVGTSPMGTSYTGPLMETPALRSLLPSPQNGTNREVFLSAGRRLASTIVEVRSGRIVTPFHLLSPYIADVSDSCQGVHPDTVEQEMQARMQYHAQLVQDREKELIEQSIAGLGSLSISQNSGQQHNPSAGKHEHISQQIEQPQSVLQNLGATEEEDEEAANDDSDSSDGLDDNYDDDDSASIESQTGSDAKNRLLIQFMDDNQSVITECDSETSYFASSPRVEAATAAGSLPPQPSTSLVRSGSSLLHASSSQNDLAAISAELRVVRQLANKLAAAVLPSDPAALAIVEPALRNASHAATVCERVAQALQKIASKYEPDMVEEQNTKQREHCKGAMPISNDASRQSDATNSKSQLTSSDAAIRRRRRLRRAARQVGWLRNELVALEPPLFSICEDLHIAGLQAPGQAVAALIQSRNSDGANDQQAQTIPGGAWITLAAGVHALSNVLFSTQVEVLERIAELRNLIDQADALLSALGLPPKVRLVSDGVTKPTWLPGVSSSAVDFTKVVTTRMLDQARQSEVEALGNSSQPTSLPSSPSSPAKPTPFVATTVPPSLLRGPSVLTEGPKEEEPNPEALAEAQRQAQAEKEEEMRRLERARMRRAKRLIDEKLGPVDKNRRQERRSGSSRHRRSGEDSDVTSSMDGSSSGEEENLDDRETRRRSHLPYDDDDDAEDELVDELANRLIQNEDESDHSRRHRDPKVLQAEKEWLRRELRHQIHAEKQGQELLQSQIELEQLGYVPQSHLQAIVPRPIRWPGESNQTQSGGFNNNGQMSRGMWNPKPFYVQPSASQTYYAQQPQQQQRRMQQSPDNGMMARSQAAGVVQTQQRQTWTNPYQAKTQPQVNVASNWQDPRPYSPNRFLPIDFAPTVTIGQLRGARAQVEAQAIECAAKMVNLSPTGLHRNLYFEQLTTLEDYLWAHEQITQKMAQLGADPGSPSADLLALLSRDSLQPAVANVLSAVNGHYHSSPAAQSYVGLRQPQQQQQQAQQQPHRPPVINSSAGRSPYLNSVRTQGPTQTPPVAPINTTRVLNNPGAPSLTSRSIAQPNQTASSQASSSRVASGFNSPTLEAQQLAPPSLIPSPTSVEASSPNVALPNPTRPTGAVVVPLAPLQVPKDVSTPPAVPNTPPQAPTLRGRTAPPLSPLPAAAAVDSDEDGPSLPPPVLTRAGPNVQ